MLVYCKFTLTPYNAMRFWSTRLWRAHNLVGWVESGGWGDHQGLSQLPSCCEKAVVIALSSAYEGGVREEGEFEDVLGTKCNHNGLCVHTLREGKEEKRLPWAQRPPLRTELHLARSSYIPMTNIHNLYDLVYAWQRVMNGQRGQARTSPQAKVQEVEIGT